MSENLITFVFFVIAGIFWVVKQVYEQRARKEAAMRRREEPETSFFEDDDNEFHFEEFEPVTPPGDAAMPSSAEVKTPQPAQQRPHAPLLRGEEQLTPARSKRYAWILQQNPRQAIIMQELLNPPKALRRH